MACGTPIPRGGRLTGHKTDKTASRPCVLVVEDDNATRRSLQLLLRSRGLDVRAHSSASQALADKRARAASCLVADLMMPEVDGVALLKALRAEGWDRPAILISGFLTPERKSAAKDAGFHSVLEKPLADTLLLSTVTRALQSAA